MTICTCIIIQLMATMTGTHVRVIPLLLSVNAVVILPKSVTSTRNEYNYTFQGFPVQGFPVEIVFTNIYPMRVFDRSV